jgi:hypothetical protein
MKTLLIFGAGASRYSESGGRSSVHPLAPPLGRDLFAELLAFDPGVFGEIPRDMADLFRINFEDGMRAFQERRRDLEISEQILLKSMGRYFLHFELRRDTGQSNLYCRMVQALLEVNISFDLSSLNYETLLEQAVRKARKRPWSFEHSSHSRSNRGLRISKPHGSSHFLPSKEFKSLQGHIVMQNVAHSMFRISASDWLEWNDLIEARTAISQWMGYVPNMSHYSVGKESKVDRGLINLQRELYAQQVREADKVVIIGVACQPRDEHIWGPLAQCDAKIGCVDPKPHAFLQWSRENDVRHKVIAASFEDCLTESRLSGDFAEFLELGKEGK